jgi:glucose-1-phosphate cytidylyltransferase
MDTLKERSWLEDLYRTGRSPWAVWHQPSPTAGRRINALEVPDINGSR